MSAEIINIQDMKLSAHYYEDDDVPEGEEDHGEQNYCCSGCMYCLGLSWRDFI